MVVVALLAERSRYDVLSVHTLAGLGCVLWRHCDCLCRLDERAIRLQCVEVCRILAVVVACSSPVSVPRFVR